ncbi:PEGA domain-containing protein, partial [Candidatus Saccharibacteria bacterium]|nr:PEGA domain-containing protein [Candidatus Saccharibacteria bacterium]
MSKKELGKEEVAEDVSLEKTEEIEPVQQVKVQKKLPTRVWVTYILMFIAIIGIVTFAVAFMMGYRLSLTGEIERTGLIQVASSPSGANIVVNGNQMGVRTRARFSLSEGEHWIEVRRDGFDTLQGHYTVKMNDILWLDYVLLFPLR